jgi:hypothetical protein
VGAGILIGVFRPEKIPAAGASSVSVVFTIPIHGAFVS